jgi:uncharacterized membrane protein
VGREWVALRYRVVLVLLGDGLGAVFSADNTWMAWNLGLAAVPMVLSFVLFRWHAERSVIWWFGCLGFVVFLPNAPYVLTDVVHLIEAIRANTYSLFVVTLILIPLYGVFMALGFAAYVVSLLNLGRYLRCAGRARIVLPVELAVHAMSAFGIYLGRFERFNSWAVVTRLDDLTDTVLDTVLARQPLLVVAVTFVVLNVLYWPFKGLVLASLSHWRSRRASVSYRAAG